MVETSRVEIPHKFLGTEVPTDLRQSLDLHTRFLDDGEARSLVAAALASWVISSSTQQPSAG